MGKDVWFDGGLLQCDQAIIAATGIEEVCNRGGDLGIIPLVKFKETVHETSPWIVVPAYLEAGGNNNLSFYFCFFCAPVD